jgi:hypothetical protein
VLRRTFVLGALREERIVCVYYCIIKNSRKSEYARAVMLSAFFVSM